MKRGPLKLFYSYAHEDEHIRDQVEEHLELLKRQNLIMGWYDRHIVPGTEWNQAIDEALNSADIVLLLISKSFMASDFIKNVEIPQAMNAHESGKVRVIPVITEEIEDWDKTPFAKLQILPTEARPITKWDDPVEAFHDVADGIRKVAKDIIIKGGGPFEFGPHSFSEAELTSLPKLVRQRTQTGLKRLEKNLQDTVPSRKYEANLLVATWALNKFGKKHKFDSDIDRESLFYIAQVISSFDLVALQEIDRNVKRLEQLEQILGPDWGILMTDIAPGVMGNNERFSILYYKPRVEFRNFSSQVVLPAKRANNENIPTKQFSRPPLIASFRSGGWEFQVCTAHIVYGKSRELSLEENKMLGDFLRKRSKYEQTELLLAGNFQMGRLDSPILDLLREYDIEIPHEILHPTNITRNKYFDLIGFISPGRSMPVSKGVSSSGSYDLYQQILRDEDIDIYDNFFDITDNIKQLKGKDKWRYRFWKTLLISDHLPLWVELNIENNSIQN